VNGKRPFHIWKAKLPVVLQLRILGFLGIVPTKQFPPFFEKGFGLLYKCEAVSIEGFIQQLAVSYVCHGYWFYVIGRIPEEKNPVAVDQKLIARYGIGISKWKRNRRKQAGLANVHYLRFGRSFVLIASKGEHRFFLEEPHFRDIRRVPIRLFGYSIGSRQGRGGFWHPSVRINFEEYRALKTRFKNLALKSSPDSLRDEFQTIRFAPYAPIRRQFLNILGAVNRIRRSAGEEPVSLLALRLRRRSLRPFLANTAEIGKPSALERRLRLALKE